MGEMADMYGAYPHSPGWNPCDGDGEYVFACVNCDKLFSVFADDAHKGSFLFCSDLCQQEGQYVRAYRRYLENGAIARPDMQEAMQTRLAMILGGGYPVRERRLARSARDAAFARDGGVCRLCGAPAMDIDHIGKPIDGDINHRDNLQALCKDCHRKKTADSFRVVTLESDPDEWRRCEAKFLALMARVEAPIPLRPCDDEENWLKTWRQLASERRAEVVEWTP